MSVETENPQPEDAGYIEHKWARGTRTYVYRFDLISLKRGNLATEVMFFKKQQIDKPPKSVNEMLLSGGGDYANRCFAYLITELDYNGEPVKFDERLTYDRALAFVNDMSMTEYDKVEACINDFFGRKNMSQLAQEISSRESTTSMLRMIAESGLLTQLPTTGDAAQSLLKSVSNSKTSTDQESSPAGSDPASTEAS
jgi:hypothetical protein